MENYYSIYKSTIGTIAAGEDCVHSTFKKLIPLCAASTDHNSNSFLNNNIRHLPCNSLPSNIPFGFYQNCSGIGTKLESFKCNVALFNYIFVCLIETWLSNSFHDNKLGLNNYIVFRCDRNCLTSTYSRAGDFLIAIRKDVQCVLLPYVINNVEHVFVKFHVYNTTFVLCSLYIPPYSPVIVYDSFVTAAQSVIDSHTGCLFIICGDFNLYHGLTMTLVLYTLLRLVLEFSVFQNCFLFTTFFS